MFTGKVYLCGVMLSIGVAVVLSSSCDMIEIGKCVKTFKDAVGNDLGDTDEEIKEACNVFRSFKTCLSPHVTEECPLEERIGYEGLTFLYDFVCGEGLLDALEYNECLPDEVEEACRDTLFQELAQNTDNDESTQCGYYMDYFSCIRVATSKNCGAEAADFMDEIYHLLLGPNMEYIGCGCGSIAAVMWVVVGVVSVQWLVR